MSMYFNAFPMRTSGTSNPACWPIDCTVSQIGPCASEAPPWGRSIGCVGIPSCNKNQECWERFQQRRDQLQMRRKAEVLQHKKNSANLTKKQRWSQISRGFSQKKQAWASQSDIYTNPNIQNLQEVPGAFILRCPATNPNEQVIHYPPGASDVPGKGPSLYLDKRIPAWGVGPHKRSFSMGNVMRSR